MSVMWEMYLDKHPAEYKIYTRNKCKWCVLAKKMFNTHELVYEEIDVTPDNVLDFKNATENATTVPQIIEVKTGKLIGGYDDLVKHLEEVK